MTSQQQGRTAHHHDWSSQEYVQSWVSRDDVRQAERLPMIRDTVAMIPHPRHQAIRVLDVGAGYGILSGEVLREFPNAHVTLQDVSEPMFEHARQRLADYAGRTSFITSDFSKPGWTAPLDKPYDVVVSAIAIHNLYNDELISNVYRDVCSMLNEGGVFLNLDYAKQAGGLEAQLEWLRRAGFSRVEHTPKTDRVTLLAGYK